MKKLLTLTLAFVALALIISCGKDDPNPGTLTIDEMNVSGLIKNAYKINDGTCCSGPLRADGDEELIKRMGRNPHMNPNRTDEVPYNYTYFYLTDGEFTFTEDGEIDVFIQGPLDLEVWMWITSEGTEFSVGDFDLYDDCNGSDFYFGADVYAYWEDNGDNYEYYERSGSITISGSGNTFTLSADGTLYNYNILNLPVRQEGEYACEYYGEADVTGEITRKFTLISEEVWNNWD